MAGVDHDSRSVFDASLKTNSKADARLSLTKDEQVRLAHLPEESALWLAGRVGMVPGALVFVIFGIPVSAMLRHAAEPEGILLADPWLRDRWMARMAITFTLAAVGAFMSWGLARRIRWARATWTVVVGLVVVLIVFLARVDSPDKTEKVATAGLICVSSILLSSLGLIVWRLWSRRGQFVFSCKFQTVFAQTPHLKPKFKAALWPGLLLALAMFILFWSLELLILFTLVASKVIRSI